MPAARTTGSWSQSGHHELGFTVCQVVIHRSPKCFRLFRLAVLDCLSCVPCVSFQAGNRTAGLAATCDPTFKGFLAFLVSSVSLNLTGPGEEQWPPFHLGFHASMPTTSQTWLVFLWPGKLHPESQPQEGPHEDSQCFRMNGSCSLLCHLHKLASLGAQDSVCLYLSSDVSLLFQRKEIVLRQHIGHS